MRHKNVSTTLRIYTQVKSEELFESLTQRPIPPKSDLETLKTREGNVIHYEFGPAPVDQSAESHPEVLVNRSKVTAALGME